MSKRPDWGAKLRPPLQDSRGNEETLGRGAIQFMTAGTRLAQLRAAQGGSFDAETRTGCMDLSSVLAGDVESILQNQVVVVVTSTSAFTGFS